MRFVFDKFSFNLEMPAFVIGNGINLYCPKGMESSGFSWTKLER